MVLDEEKVFLWSISCGVGFLGLFQSNPRWITLLFIAMFIFGGFGMAKNLGSK